MAGQLNEGPLSGEASAHLNERLWAEADVRAAKHSESCRPAQNRLQAAKEAAVLSVCSSVMMWLTSSAHASSMRRRGVR